MIRKESEKCSAESCQRGNVQLFIREKIAERRGAIVCVSITKDTKGEIQSQLGSESSSVVVQRGALLTRTRKCARL